MTTMQWLVISISLFDIGYYIGRWVGRSQEKRKAFRAKLFGDREIPEGVRTGID